MTDIRKFSVAPTGRLHLRDAADEPMYADDACTLPIAVNVYGPGSKQFAKAKAAFTARNESRPKRKSAGHQTSEHKAEQRLEEIAEFLADCTANFENLQYDTLTGSELALAVYSDVSLGFIADQVNTFLGDWANFKQVSTAT